MNHHSKHDLIDIEYRLGAFNYKPLGVVLSRGEGVWVWDTDGERYMDCLSAYSAVPLVATRLPVPLPVKH